MNIILSGMPGSGKTTIAEVFKTRGKQVYDTDAEIVKNYGVISEIFEKHGEEYFRDLETRTVRSLSELSDAVIATGGGCLMSAENAEIFRQSGKIVYLRTSYETLLKRVEGNCDRPLLNGDTRGNLLRLYNARTPVYESRADFIIDTDGMTPEQIADRITETVR